MALVGALLGAVVSDTQFGILMCNLTLILAYLADSWASFVPALVAVGWLIFAFATVKR